MDEDGSGTLSLEEFKKAMALHPEVPQERVEQIFHDMDIAHHGEVDYNSFLAATVASSKQFQEARPSQPASDRQLASLTHDVMPCSPTNPSRPPTTGLPRALAPLPLPPPPPK